MSAHTDNEIVIGAPVDVVWEEANNLAQWPVLYDGEYERAEILESPPDRVVFRLTMKPAEDGRRYSWVSERVPDPARRQVVARRIETGPFLYMHIVHDFSDTGDGGTRLRWIQDFEMRPNAPFTDQQMAARINRGSEHNLRTHKQVIEQHWRDKVNG
jgi:aromatase